MELKKTILIIGVNGQDGSILSSIYLSKGYDVIGTIRSNDSDVSRLKYLSIYKEITVELINPLIESEISDCIAKYQPKIIFPLGSLTSVGLSFHKPKESLESNILLIQNVCESVKNINKKIKIFNPLSSEMYGVQNESIHIDLIPRPVSPYGIAKKTCLDIGRFYSNHHNLRIYNIVLFNHESELRSRNFVTRKIIETAIDIRKGLKEIINLGNLNISRDWGCAYEFCDFISQIMDKETNCDLVLGTGETNSLLDFVEYAFEINNLNYKDYLLIDKSLVRNNDIQFNSANTDRLEKLIGSTPKIKMRELVLKITKKIDNENWNRLQGFNW